MINDQRHLDSSDVISRADIRNLFLTRTLKRKKEKRKENLLGKQTSGVASPYAVCSAAPDAAADSPAVEEASPVDPLSLPVKVNPSQVVNNQ